MSLDRSFSVSRHHSHDSNRYSPVEDSTGGSSDVVSFRDEGSDDSGKNKSKKRRKKVGSSGRSQWGFRQFWRWKFSVLALSAMGLLVLLEVRHLLLLRIPYSSPLLGKDEENVQETRITTTETVAVSQRNDDEKESPLNSLAMPTHKVGNLREACLKLLTVEETEQLTLPAASYSPIRRLRYATIKANGTTFAGGEGTLSSAFSGYQSMEERSDSFKVRETMEVHCGFFDRNSGFDISKNDKSYLEKCIMVVATCIFGGGDDLNQPIGMTNASLSQVCYVAFWDKVTLEMQASQGKEVNPVTHKAGLWRIVMVKDLPFSDQRRNGKIPKMLSHRLFPKARYSIWVDAKYQFRRDPLGVFESLLWRTHTVFAISEHGGRNCMYKEGEAIVKKHKALPDEVAVQLDQYRAENVPENAKFENHKALAEASVIVREHTTLTNLFMCLWFNEVMRFTARDQLSYVYVLLRLQGMRVNMFPVCTRRALVNSLGHKRKAKLLKNELN